MEHRFSNLTIVLLLLLFGVEGWGRASLKNPPIYRATGDMGRIFVKMCGEHSTACTGNAALKTVGRINAIAKKGGAADCYDDFINGNRMVHVDVQYQPTTYKGHLAGFCPGKGRKKDKGCLCKGIKSESEVIARVLKKEKGLTSKFDRSNLSKLSDAVRRNCQGANSMSSVSVLEALVMYKLKKSKNPRTVLKQLGNFTKGNASLRNKLAVKIEDRLHQNLKFSKRSQITKKDKAALDTALKSFRSGKRARGAVNRAALMRQIMSGMGDKVTVGMGLQKAGAGSQLHNATVLYNETTGDIQVFRGEKATAKQRKKSPRMIASQGRVAPEVAKMRKVIQAKLDNASSFAQKKVSVKVKTDDGWGPVVIQSIPEEKNGKINMGISVLEGGEGPELEEKDEGFESKLNLAERRNKKPPRNESTAERKARLENEREEEEERKRKEAEAEADPNRELAKIEFNRQTKQKRRDLGLTEQSVAFNREARRFPGGYQDEAKQLSTQTIGSFGNVQAALDFQALEERGIGRSKDGVGSCFSSRYRKDGMPELFMHSCKSRVRVEERFGSDRSIETATKSFHGLGFDGKYAEGHVGYDSEKTRTRNLTRGEPINEEVNQNRRFEFGAGFGERTKSDEDDRNAPPQDRALVVEGSVSRTKERPADFVEKETELSASKLFMLGGGSWLRVAPSWSRSDSHDPFEASQSKGRSIEIEGFTQRRKYLFSGQGSVSQYAGKTIDVESGRQTRSSKRKTMEGRVELARKWKSGEIYFAPAGYHSKSIGTGRGAPDTRTVQSIQSAKIGFRENLSEEQRDDDVTPNNFFLFYDKFSGNQTGQDPYSFSNQSVGAGASLRFDNLAISRSLAITGGSIKATVTRGTNYDVFEEKMESANAFKLQGEVTAKAFDSAGKSLGKITSGAGIVLGSNINEIEKWNVDLKYDSVRSPDVGCFHQQNYSLSAGHNQDRQDTYIRIGGTIRGIDGIISPGSCPKRR